MSDMPGPRSTPSPSSHGQHDELLVAQLAAGDPLDPAQLQEARRLVTGCPACAALAADLSAISRAVAWEPVPPRRRDFRFDAERAAQLRGSRLQRLLRRFALPRSAALRPVAAGVMSVGLLFLVAGAVWPQTQPAAAPVPGAALSSAAPVLRVEAPPAGDAEDAAEAGAVEEPAAAVEEPAAAVEEPAADAFFMEAVPEPAQADAPAMGAEPMATEAESGSAADAGPAADDVTERAKAMSIDAVASLEAAALAAGAEIGDSAASSMVPRAMVPPAPSVPASGAAADMQASATSVADGVSAEPGADVLTHAAPSVVDGPGVQDVLLVVGLVLASAGALLLLVVWLARRVADPLLR